MPSRNQPVNIQQRTLEYALRAVRLYRHLYKLRDGAGLILGKQFLRAATSVGANLVEAQSGESRRDFIHKCSIAQKEARESKYWLVSLMRSEIVSCERMGDLVREADEIIAILTRIIVNTKQRTAP